MSASVIPSEIFDETLLQFLAPVRAVPRRRQR